jgi:hypothetical protein
MPVVSVAPSGSPSGAPIVRVRSPTHEAWELVVALDGAGSWGFGVEAAAACRESLLQRAWSSVFDKKEFDEAVCAPFRHVPDQWRD